METGRGWGSGSVEIGLELLEEAVYGGWPGLVGLAAHGFCPDEGAPGGVGSGGVDAQGAERAIGGAEIDGGVFRGNEHEGEVGGEFRAGREGLAELLDEVFELGGGEVVLGAGFYAQSVSGGETAAEGLQITGVDLLLERAAGGGRIGRALGVQRDRRNEQQGKRGQEDRRGTRALDVGGDAGAESRLAWEGKHTSVDERKEGGGFTRGWLWNLRRK